MKTVDKIIEYFKNNPILGIILLVVVVVLVAVIIWAIVAACKKSGKKKNDAEQPDTAVEDTSELADEEPQQVIPYEEMPVELNEKEEETAETPVPEPAVQAPAETEPEPEKKEIAAEEQPEKVLVTEEKKQAPKKPRKTQSKEALAKIYSGKWVVSVSGQNDDGTPSYSFELRASNGEKLLSSVDYKSVQGAKNGIKTYKSNIEKDNFTIAQNKKGEFYFRLLNGSGHLLSTGEQYQSKSSCENALDSVQRFAMTAVIVVEEEE